MKSSHATMMKDLKTTEQPKIVVPVPLDPMNGQYMYVPMRARLPTPKLNPVSNSTENSLTPK